jgi:hypothetical protein
MNAEQLKAILVAHAEYLKTGDESKRANLSRADLSRANLSRADLSWANLSEADLSWANLSRADLSWANLSRANLSRANLRSANLRSADLRSADLSGAKNVFDPVAYVAENFKRVRGGIEVWKRIGGQYAVPESWVIEAGAEISEVVNPLPTCDCACGVNVGTETWCRGNYVGAPLWRCLVKWEWLPSMVVPYNTTGKVRVGRVKLIELVTK